MSSITFSTRRPHRHPSYHPLCGSFCRFRLFCGDTGISSGYSLQVLSSTPTSFALHPTWHRPSQRSTAATASKATPSTWTARVTRIFSDRTALLCEGGPQILALEVRHLLFKNLPKMLWRLISLFFSWRHANVHGSWEPFSISQPKNSNVSFFS